MMPEMSNTAQGRTLAEADITTGHELQYTGDGRDVRQSIDGTLAIAKTYSRAQTV